jgi:hypothetical protein
MLEKLRVQMQTQFDQWYQHLHNRPELMQPIPGGVSNPNASMDSKMTAEEFANSPFMQTTPSSSFSSATTTASYTRTNATNPPNASLNSTADSKSLPPIYPTGSEKATAPPRRAPASGGSTAAAPVRAEAKGNGIGAGRMVAPIADTKDDDDDVNEDILAFYQAKEELLKRRQQNN